MVFSGIPFLYYFLPCVLLAYFVVPGKARNVVLLIASLLFYAWGEPVYVLLMLFTIVIGFLSGISMEKSREHSWRIMTPGRILAGSIFVFYFFSEFIRFFSINYIYFFVFFHFFQFPLIVLIYIIYYFFVRIKKCFSAFILFFCFLSFFKY